MWHTDACAASARTTPQARPRGVLSRKGTKQNSFLTLGVGWD